MRIAITLLLSLAVPVRADSTPPADPGQPGDACAVAAECIAAPSDCSGRCRAIARRDAPAFKKWIASVCDGTGLHRGRDAANCGWKVECAARRCQLVPPPLPGGATVEKITEIELSRGGCEGNCPQYAITLRSDGRADYQGNAFVPLLGKRHARITAAEFRALAEHFARNDFFRMKSTCRTAEAAVDAAVCFSVAAVLDGKRYLAVFDEAEGLISTPIDKLVEKLPWSGPEAPPK
jgi:hypothetical protein